MMKTFTVTAEVEVYCTSLAEAATIVSDAVKIHDKGFVESRLASRISLESFTAKEKTKKR